MTSISPRDLLSIGEVAKRAGVRVSTVRYYADRGLLPSIRSAGGSRLFPRSTIRRIAFVLIAQELGLSLEVIAAELARLPSARTPTSQDWARIGRAMRASLEAQIVALQRTRDRLDGCIGCGCLSLKACALYNPQDRAARRGPGPRYVLHGEDPDSTPKDT
jgi:MerR family redox-sensitive transcriptional activator SoxR